MSTAWTDCQRDATLPRASDRCRPVTRRTALTSVPLVALVSLRAASRDARRILASFEFDDGRRCTLASFLLHRAVSRVIAEIGKVRIDGLNRPSRSLVRREERVSSLSLSLPTTCTLYTFSREIPTFYSHADRPSRISSARRRDPRSEHPSRAPKRRRVTIAPRARVAIIVIPGRNLRLAIIHPFYFARAVSFTGICPSLIAPA